MRSQGPAYKGQTAITLFYAEQQLAVSGEGPVGSAHQKLHFVRDFAGSFHAGQHFFAVVSGFLEEIVGFLLVIYGFL